MPSPARTDAIASRTASHRRLAWLIGVSLLARLLFAAATGLGNDESYMVASGRQLHLGYFDHPPLSWWMAWGGAHLFGTDAALAVRLPFIALFALTTWLMFRLTETLFSAPAGLWAAGLLNLAPVFGLTTATWVLPDGPLLAALLGAAICLVTALRAEAGGGWSWWLATGACAGLALFSKYTAALSLFGALVYLLTTPRGRAWLRRAPPYASGLLALLIFAPVLAWNAAHGWQSMRFQLGRAGGATLHPFGPLLTLAGEGLYLLPWIGAPLLVCLVLALRDGSPKDDRLGPRWLLACLALPPILLFELVSLHGHVLFHWANPGYLMLFPLLGDALARHHWAVARRVMIGTVALLLVGVALAGSEMRFNWLAGLGARAADGTLIDIEGMDWASLPPDLAARGLTARPGLVLAATRWQDAGKLDYAFAGRLPVLCLSADAREYGLLGALADHAQADALIIGPRLAQADLQTEYGVYFDRIEPLPGATLRHAGRPAMVLNLFLGHRLHLPAPPAATP